MGTIYGMGDAVVRDEEAALRQRPRGRLSRAQMLGAIHEYEREGLTLAQLMARYPGSTLHTWLCRFHWRWSNAYEGLPFVAPNNDDDLALVAKSKTHYLSAEARDRWKNLRDERYRQAQRRREQQRYETSSYF